MKKSTIKISGMSCAHCVASIEKALSGAQGVKSAKVDLKKANATVEFDDKKTNDSRLKEIINELGYEA